MILRIEVTEGAGDNFLDTVIEAIHSERDNVYIQVAGEYGHLIVEELISVEEDE